VDSCLWAPMLALSFTGRTDSIIGSTPARCRLRAARMGDKAKPPSCPCRRLCCPHFENSVRSNQKPETRVGSGRYTCPSD